MPSPRRRRVTPLHIRQRSFLRRVHALQDRLPTIFQRALARQYSRDSRRRELPGILQQLRHDMQEPLQNYRRELFAFMREPRIIEVQLRDMIRGFCSLERGIIGFYRRPHGWGRRLNIPDAERRALVRENRGRRASDALFWDAESETWQNIRSPNFRLEDEAPLPFFPTLNAVNFLCDDLRRLEPVELADGDRTCAICQEEYHTGQRPEVAVQLPCKHHFGNVCLTEWVLPKGGESHNTCPLCRRVLFRKEDGRRTEGQVSGTRYYQDTMPMAGAMVGDVIVID